MATKAVELAQLGRNLDYDETNKEINLGGSKDVLTTSSTTDDLPEGTTHRYFHNDLTREAISVSSNGMVSYDEDTGIITANYPSTLNVSEDTNLYFTTQRARDSVSVTSTGYGTLAYTSGTGVFSYTGITDSEIETSIGQALDTTDSPTFVNVTADLIGNADTATTWETSREISLTGDVTGTATGVDGSANVSIATTIAANSVALGTDTTGNYMADVSGGTDISVTHTQGEGSTATVNNTSTLDTVTDRGATTTNDVTVGDLTATDITATTVSTDYVDLATDQSSVTHAEGRIFYDNTNDALAVYNSVSDITLQVGQEEYIRVYNNSGATITNGTPVYIVGSSNDVPTIAEASASTEAASQAVGLATHDIANTTYGFVTVRGLVGDLDTSALTVGNRVHVSATAGELVEDAPTYPYFPVDIGICLVSHASTGCIYVDVQSHNFEELRITGNARVDSDLTVGGDLTVLGTQTIASSNNVSIGSAWNYFNSGDTIGESNTTFTGSGLDDGVLTGHYEGTTSNRGFYVAIDGTGTPDTFKWSHNSDLSSPEATAVAITGADQDLAEGISIKFNATTGHTSGDKWGGTASPVNVDSGIASNRNTGGSGVGYTHMGLFFDVSDQKWKFFDEYDPEPEGTINTADASFSGGTVVADTFEGDLTGDVTGNVTGDVTGNVTGTADNADTVDNLHASSFLRSDADDTATGQITFPTAIASRPVFGEGILARSDQDDTSGTHDIWGISERYYPSNSTAGDAWGIQWSGTPNEINFIGAGQKKLSIDLDTDGEVKIDGSRILTVADEGSGNGLDADTVDGLEATSFVRADASDVMTGNLRLNDSVELSFGNSDDIKMYYTSTQYLDFKYLNTNNGGIRFRNGSDTQKGYIYADNGGFGVLNQDGQWALKTTATETTLHYDGSEKLATTSTGVEITGSLTVNGTALVSGLNYTESASPPSSPSNGDEWYDTGEDILYKRIGGNWLQLSPSGGVKIFDVDGNEVS